MRDESATLLFGLKRHSMVPEVSSAREAFGAEIA